MLRGSCGCPRKGIKMRIITYNTELDQDRKNVLVKESSHNYPDMEKLNNPENIAYMLNKVFRADKQAEEHAYLIAMDCKCQPIGVFNLSHGIATGSYVGKREIFVRLCLCGAVGFVLAHNHPSGDPFPSEQDVNITKQIKACADLMEITMYDHIIIGNENLYSFQREEKM